jgi:hypothetical protein
MKCPEFRWTPSHRRLFCRLDEGHEGRHSFPATIPPIEEADERDEEERERARHEHPSNWDQEKDWHDPRTEHRVLRNIGLRHGSADLESWEQEADA